ncbi:MAG: hypothetical protein HFF01_03570 [Erysipelotrichaceae bacterium]|nr:hypothetical protein [Erysipelotrichaceae bacterium]
MRQLLKILDGVINRCFFLFALVLFLSMLFVKAMYHYEDYPYFTYWDLLDVFLVIVIFVLIWFLWKHIDWIESKLNIKWIALGYVLIALSFIYLVPLKPFSDMQHVSEGAIRIASFDMDGLKGMAYFKTFKGNIKTSLFYAIPLMILPKTIVSMKVVNVFLLLGIAYLIRRIAQHMHLRYTNMAFLMVLTFLPVFLYINHIYFELYFILLMLAGINCYLKDSKNLIITSIIFAIAYYLRKNGLILLGAVLTDVFISHPSSWKNTLVSVVISLCLFFGISFTLNQITSMCFYDKEALSYPKWNQYYIGINEEKFGFMDQSFSYDRSLEDVITRMQEYGPWKMTQILVKKTAWAWGEGTYQSGRYAFGLNTDMANEKFEYATFIEKYITLDSQFIRRFITTFSRCQYVLYFFFMTYALWRKKDPSFYRLGGVIYLGTFVALLFYELKSRYVMHCFPFMILFAICGIDLFFKDVNTYNNKKRLSWNR